MSHEINLDRIYCIIRDHFKEAGFAPHYTDLARELRVTPDEGRLALHALMDSPFPCWLHPGTDYIGSFPPFSLVQPLPQPAFPGYDLWGRPSVRAVQIGTTRVRSAFT